MRAIAAFLFLCISTVLAAAEPPEYLAMRAARPDGRTASVADLTLVRDAFRLHFRSGTFHFLAPVGERTWGAVFAGDGLWELRAAVERERKHLALVTNRPDLEILSDTFSSMVLLFSDRTADEIAAKAPIGSGAPDPKAMQLYEEYLHDQKRKYQTNLHLRVLQELLNEPAARGDVFIAAVDGKELAPSLLVFDRRGIGALAARFADVSGEESALISFDEHNGGFWYLASAADRNDAPRSVPTRRPFDAVHYTIDTTIEGNTEIRGTVTVRMEAMAPGFRVVPIHIMPKIRIRKASLRDGGGQPVELAFVQEEVQLGKFARLFRDEVGDADAAVILPAPLDPKKPVELTLQYEGREVLQAWGPDSYSVMARESWYPNLGTFVDTATYELTYRYPRRNHLISTGVLAGEKEEEGKKIAVWKSALPMRVAGFNYGRFQKVTREDQQSGVRVDVYTSRDHVKFANDAMADAINSARVARMFFGNAPYTPFSVTQQVQWNFGQSWPSLIYLPTLALTSSTERVMAFEDAGPQALFGLNEFAKMVGWHEVAHQWWGHAVGWQTYRDVWLSEGFAEFTSALVLQLVEGTKKYDDYWERRRREIVHRPRRGTIAHNDAGPISQSYRLSTRYTPGAAQTLIYSKGAYVVHMLRMLMRDPRSQSPDERFMAMMRDFLTTWSWKSPSTDDFKRVVEKHMTPQMNAAGNGKMDWFFDQWVHGTDVPQLRSTLAVAPAGDGRYRITGAVTQEGVSSTFITVVPIYVDFGKDVVLPIGMIRLVGNTSLNVNTEAPMPRAPEKVLVNAFHDVLVRD